MRHDYVRCLLIGLLFAASRAEAGQPILEGYSDYQALRVELESIAESKFASIESLGQTLGGREVLLLRIGAGKVDRKPAVLIVGGVHPPHLLGSELALRVARSLVQQAETDKRVRKMLGRVSFYVIPRVAPDACEAFFRVPYVEQAGNQRPVDDDRDGEVDEDGPEDLNGDGLITMIRVSEARRPKVREVRRPEVEDPKGTYLPHPDDARVMIQADPKKNERGRYLLFPEGRDNDQDEQHGEDPAGGVEFNRNFTFRYPYFGPGAGPHQVSEPETRAVADFAFSHPNIAAVVSFSPEDNLMHPWKPDKDDKGKEVRRPEVEESKRIKTSLLKADAGYFDHVAEMYQEIHAAEEVRRPEVEDAPESSKGEGSFSEWAYFHFGRWSFAARGWWIPNLQPEQQKKDKEEDKEEPPEDKRGAEELNALQWFDREGIEGFVAWQEIQHPDFPDKKVEVGGFKPFLRWNPPGDALDALAEKHTEFVRRLVRQLPRLVIEEAKAESLGGRVWRVTVVVGNEGYLPTVSEMGRITRQPHPVQVRLVLPKGTSLVTGHSRVQLPPLAGRGGHEERSWLVLVSGEKPETVRVRAWSPSVGNVVKRIQLREQPQP